MIRHYTNLSRENEGIDTTFYPLGSCTMKHNPRANEAAAVVPGFAGLHPLQPEAQVQGALRIMHELQGFLAEVSGLPHVSLQPLAGAQGELTSILMVKKYFEDAGDDGAHHRPRSLDGARDQPGDGLDGRVQVRRRSGSTSTAALTWTS